MRVTNTREATESFKSEEGETLRVRYDNRGEPYREGVSLDFESEDQKTYIGVFLEGHEAKRLRDVLLKLYPLSGPAKAEKRSARVASLDKVSLCNKPWRGPEGVWNEPSPCTLPVDHEGGCCRYTTDGDG